MRGFALFAVLLLAVPIVAAIHEPKPQCYTRRDCAEIARTTQVLCAPGYVPDPEPECSGGKCGLCHAVQYRPRVDCRIDTDCAAKRTCARGLAAQCVGSKCVCALPRPECKVDRDCMRSLFLQRNYQRMVCLRGKCVAPQATVTMLPRSWTKPVY